VKVTLYSGTWKEKGNIDILPVHVCGHTSYQHWGELAGRKVDPTCQDCPLIETPGGRRRELICLHPKHYNNQEVELFPLTAPEVSGIRQQIGDEYSKYVRPASVHGAWKIRRNQGVVVVPKKDGDTDGKNPEG